MNNDSQRTKTVEREAYICKLDSLLPRWWVWLFQIGVTFAVIYVLYYHVLRIG